MSWLTVAFGESLDEAFELRVQWPVAAAAVVLEVGAYEDLT
jgi:hypothetical protein